jgi:hypothetical protein
MEQASIPILATLSDEENLLYLDDLGGRRGANGTRKCRPCHACSAAW